MAYETNWNNYVAMKKQSGKGSAASGSGGSLIPLTGGRLNFGKSTFQSQQVQQDGLPRRGRHGLQKVSAPYQGELQLKNWDAIFEAVMRGSFSAAVTITNSTPAMSSGTLSVAGHVVTSSAGSFLTAGVKVNDVHRWASGVNSADQNKPLRVTGVTALTITYAESLTSVAGPVSTWSVTIGKVLVNPAAGSLVKPYYTLEEGSSDSSTSRLVSDFCWSKIDLKMQDGIITIAASGVGTGDYNNVPSGSLTFPVLTGPTMPLPNAISLAAIDTTLRFESGDIVDLTSFDLTLDLGLIAPGNSGARKSADVFDGVLMVNAAIGMFKSDLTEVGNFLNESSLSVNMLAAVPGSSPVDYISITVPYITLGDVQISSITRNAGPATQTLTIPKDTIGIDPTGGAFEATVVKFCTSST